MKKKNLFAVGSLAVTIITAFIAYDKGYDKGYEKGKKFNDEFDDDYDLYGDVDFDE